MRKFLPILALVAVTCWSAGEVSAQAAGVSGGGDEPHGPTGFKKQHGLETGHRNEPAYRVGFNLAWTEACNLSGTWDKIQVLYKKTKKILSDKDRSLFEDGEGDIAGQQAGACTAELYALVIADIEKFVRDKEGVTSGPSGVGGDLRFFTGYRKEPAYKMGWNLGWAEACSIRREYDRIVGLDLKARKVLSGRERQLMVRGKTDIRGTGVGGCSARLVHRVLIRITKSFKERETPKAKGSSVEDRLRKLKYLFRQGLITKAEAAEKRKEVLRSM